MSTTIKEAQDTRLAIDVLDCGACRIDDKFPGILRSGDSLEGQIRVKAESNESIRAATVRLQGVQMASLYIVTGKHPHGADLQASFKFLDIPYQPLPRPRGSQKFLTLPFQFIIPGSEARANNDRPLQCQQLPPSFNVRSSYSQKWTPYPPPQSYIVYKIHCEVTLNTVNGGSSAEPLTFIAEREISFLPYVEPQPPTYVSRFPSEFILELQRPVWKHFLGRRVGVLKASTEEPRPLAYTSDSLAPSTECYINFTLSGHSIDAQFCNKISIRVSSILRSKTFFSVENIPCVPTQALLARNRLLRLYDDVTKVGDSEFRNLAWRYTPGTDSQIEHSLSDEALSITTPSSLSMPAKVLTQESLQPLGESSSATVGSWNASIRFPVSPDMKQQPTFCTDLFARSYSLLFRVRISGAYVKMLDFEVPLQVVYPHTVAETPEPLSLEKASPCLGRIALYRQDSVSSRAENNSAEADNIITQSLPDYDDI